MTTVNGPDLDDYITEHWGEDQVAGENEGGVEPAVTYERHITDRGSLYAPHRCINPMWGVGDRIGSL